MLITVYDTQNCMKCRLTEKRLTEAGVSFRHTLATDYDIERFRQLGASAFPVVFIDGELAWFDFKPEMIKKVVEKYGATR